MSPKGQYYQLEMPVSFVPFTEYVLECVSLEMNGNGACFVCVFALVGLSQQHSFTLFLKRHFIYLWLSWVFVVAQAFSSSGEQGTARSCRVQAYRGGFSPWRAWALVHSGFRRHGTCSQ